jgi:hypothetical protein
VSGVLLVGAGDCAICNAARGCTPAVVLDAAALLENARAHLLVALVMGLRREAIPLCEGCKGKLAAFEAHIRRGAS